MMEIYAKPGTAICLGRRGENLARKVIFDLTEWRSLYGDGKVHLVVRRTGDVSPYPAVISVVGNEAIWEITSADTAIPGSGGQAELQYYVGEVLAKSSIWGTIVFNALGEATETPPEPQKDWVDQVLRAAEDVEKAAAVIAAISVENETLFI